ncbi:MAG: FISUMP domain-containing protein [Bacteroidota bacterium]
MRLIYLLLIIYLSTISLNAQSIGHSAAIKLNDNGYFFPEHEFLNELAKANLATNARSAAWLQDYGYSLMEQDNFKLPIFYYAIAHDIAKRIRMAENLKYGTQVDTIAEVRNDNTVQKICYKHNATNCEEGATYYLWDEMMNYDVVPRSQGICPEGWIIPNEADFETLMATINSFNILFESEFKAEQLGYVNNCAVLNNCDNQHKPEAFNKETISNVWEFGNRAWFWTSTKHPSNTDFAYFFQVSDYKNVGTHMQTMPQYKIFGCCVRCIKK